MAGGSALSSAANLFTSQKQMDFQERMSNTKHQRNVKDLRAAGLNPILSATSGMGGGSPQGTKAQLENPAAGIADIILRNKMAKLS